MTKIEATTKAKMMLNTNTVDELARKIGISKPTLYTRFAEHNWKLGEIELIKQLK